MGKASARKDIASKTSRMGEFFAECWGQLEDTVFSWLSWVDLKPGDLIEIFRTGYQHWAVYVGLGEVIHLTSADKCAEARAEAGSMKSLWAKKAMVKREPLSNAVGENEYRVSNKHDATYDVRTPDQIVSMAEKLEGQIVDYELITQNCEHFANSLRYDVARCDQLGLFSCLAPDLYCITFHRDPLAKVYAEEAFILQWIDNG